MPAPPATNDSAAATTRDAVSETGPAFTCGRRSDGAVLCWGDNSEGQLGNGETTDPLTYGEYSPVPIEYAPVAVGTPLPGTR